MTAEAAGSPGAPASAGAVDLAAWLHLLQAEQSCRDLVLRSAVLADAGDARGVAALFTESAELVRPIGAAIHGRPAIELSYRDRPAERITAHLVCGTLFHEVGQEMAQATSRVLVWTADARTDAGPHGRAADPRQRLGWFVDSFALTSEGWRISHRRAGFELFRD